MTRSSRGTALRWSSAREEEEDNVLPRPIVRNARHCVPSDILRHPSLTTSPRSFLVALRNVAILVLAHQHEEVSG